MERLLQESNRGRMKNAKRVTDLMKALETLQELRHDKALESDSMSGSTSPLDDLYYARNGRTEGIEADLK